MANIFDRLLNISPQGLPVAPENPARVADAVPLRLGLTGTDKPSLVHLTNPYKPNVGGHTMPTPRLSGLLIPPSRRNRMAQVSQFVSPGRALGATTAPGIVGHPGRRLGHTGNPGKRVGQR